MGAACCVAAGDKTTPAVSSGDRGNGNSRYSPTWSIRWENRGRVAGEDASAGWLPDGINSHYNGIDSKLGMTYASEGGGSLDDFQRRMWPKSPLSDGTVEHERNFRPDRSISRAISMDTVSHQVESRESSAYVFPSPAKLSLSSVPSTSSPLTLSSQAHSASSTLSRRSNHSQKLLQPVPRNMTPAGKSPRSPTAAVAMPPNPPSTNELKRGSSGGLSDSWSVNAFTELMSSSCGGGSSPVSEAMGMSPDKVCKNGIRMSASTSGGPQACGVCLKSLTERSSWSGQMIIASSKLPVVAILICGHVYHADCLEVMTSDIDKYDPACPVCTLGERRTFEMYEKALLEEKESSAKRDRRSKNQVVDTDASRDLARLRIDGGDGKGIIKGSSSSASRRPLPRPFFHRNFSFGSRGSRTLTEVHSKKGRGLRWSKSSKE